MSAGCRGQMCIRDRAKAPYVAQFVRALLDADERVLLFAHHHQVMDLSLIHIYSPLPGRFDEGDREGLEALARLLIAGCDWDA